jgi:hypothetical protein
MALRSSWISSMRRRISSYTRHQRQSAKIIPAPPPIINRILQRSGHSEGRAHHFSVGGIDLGGVVLQLLVLLLELEPGVLAEVVGLLRHGPLTLLLLITAAAATSAAAATLTLRRSWLLAASTASAAASATAALGTPGGGGLTAGLSLLVTLVVTALLRHLWGLALSTVGLAHDLFYFYSFEREVVCSD